ncbi:hypothetical protein [Nocardioides marmotae]|uniref:hypothetical protein n=1 Tax=Nocardioides marmotae TaxID=2663857 RepID=UPI0012B5083D|nr:hypothetical protein [Nocardioides marmotae]MBC9732262.1 hypothetical protein [Nocardioides marmotae]MTB83383.1 hypothetical protein [Nocardioides marmotae]
MVVVAAMMAVVIVAAALAVDLGMQRVGRQDMQALADVVALDLARELDGRPVEELGDMQALADASRDRNGDTLGSVPVVTPELGIVNPATGVFAPIASGVPNAVRLTASTNVPFSFGIASSGGASAEAVGFAQPGACMRLGSSALDLRTENSVLLNAVLGDILNASVGLSALNYDGLAQATIRLDDLAVALGAGSATELLNTSVSLKGFYVAIVDVLKDDPATKGVADILNAGLVQLIGAGIGLGNVKVGELLDLGASGDAALVAGVDVLSLLTAGAFVANGENAIAIPATSLSIPSVANLRVSASVIEPPKIACGKGMAQTSQVRLKIKGDFGIPLVLDGDLEVSLDLANASGSISAVGCVAGSPTSLSVLMHQPTLARLDVALGLNLLGLIPVAKVVVPGTVPTAGSGGTYTLPLPAAFDVPVRTAAGTGGIGLPDLSKSSLEVLGLDLTWVPGVTSILSLLNVVLDGVVDLLTGTLATLLGLNISSADMFAVRTPQCLTPSLAG